MWKGLSRTWRNKVVFFAERFISMMGQNTSTNMFLYFLAKIRCGMVAVLLGEMLSAWRGEIKWWNRSRATRQRQKKAAECFSRTGICGEILVDTASISTPVCAQPIMCSGCWPQVVHWRHTCLTNMQRKMLLHSTLQPLRPGNVTSYSYLFRFRKRGTFNCP